MLVSLITCTGARPEAFARCEEYIKRQTYKGQLQWLVVDDYPDKPTKCTLPCQTRIPGPKVWRPGINTQRPNMDVALPLVKGDYIFIIEDDDWYSPNFIDHYLRLLRYYPIVGEGNSTYYNVLERSWIDMKNYDRCSLCQTGLRKDKLDVLDRAVNSGELFMDCALWSIIHREKLDNFIFLNQDLCVGIKGMPGRMGIGSGHRPEANYKKDPGLEKLKELVGEEDANYYKEVYFKEAAKAVLARTNKTKPAKPEPTVVIPGRQHVMAFSTPNPQK